MWKQEREREVEDMGAVLLENDTINRSLSLRAVKGAVSPIFTAP